MDGALLPIETHLEVVEAAGIPFQVRIVDSLRRKPAPARAGSTRGNPFLPYEPALLVAELPPAHVVLLNKFPVIQDHLLIVTRAFVDQLEPLGEGDYTALAFCMAGDDGLGFYNAGAAAGASQPHRHLQWVPALGPAPWRAPIDGAVAQALTSDLGALPGFRFPHAIARLDAAVFDDPDAAGRMMSAVHSRLRSALAAAGGLPTYNLLVTRDWMMHVPRTASGHQGVEVNAVGFAGSLLARDLDALELVRRIGPVALLEAVTAAACPPDR